MAKKTTDKMTAKMTENMEHANKAVEQYIELGVKVQDEMFNMAQKQMDGFRQYTEFALKQQKEFFAQFEKNAKNTRELWLEGLKSLQTSVKTPTEDK